MKKSPISNTSRQITLHVPIRALAAHDNHNGTFSIEIPANELPPETTKLLEELFKHTFSKVEHLLSVEALLSAIATPREASEPPPKEVTNLAPPFCPGSDDLPPYNDQIKPKY